MHANYQQLKHFCEIWLRAHTAQMGHKQIEHNDRNKSMRPIKIFIIQTAYCTAKPFNLIDYKSWIKTPAKTSNKKCQIESRTKKRHHFMLCRWLRFSHMIDGIFVLLALNKYGFIDDSLVCKWHFFSSHLIAGRMVEKEKMQHPNLFNISEWAHEFHTVNFEQLTISIKWIERVFVWEIKQNINESSIDIKLNGHWQIWWNWPKTKLKICFNGESIFYVKSIWKKFALARLLDASTASIPIGICKFLTENWCARMCSCDQMIQ